MSQMIEKLARALCAANGEDPDRFDIIQDDTGPLPYWAIYEDDVIALLTALREPSEEMVRIGATAIDYIEADDWKPGHRTEARTAFTAMIDSILPKGGEG